LPQSATVARSPQVAVAAAEGNVNAKLSNKPINPTPFAASRRLLAQAARRDSCAGYRQRSAELQTWTARLHFPMSVKLSL